MSMFSNVTAAAKTVATNNPDAAAAPAQAQPPELPQPQAAWTDATTAALVALADFFRQGREAMRETKKAMDASRQAAMEKEVKAMRDEAKEIRNGALVQAATLAISAHNGAMAVTTSDAGLAAKYRWAADSWGKGDGIAKGYFDSRAKERQADGAAARASAERAKTSGEDIQELADTQAELTSKAMDAIRSVLEARHAATMGVLMQRG